MGYDIDNDPLWQELLNFHWDPSRLGLPMPQPEPYKGLYWHHMNKQIETWNDRINRMLLSMNDTVNNCSICHLGREMCEERHVIFDPHVFSNMIPSKWMIVGQNPGYDECFEHKPFIGEAGKFFDRQLLRFGLMRKDFYVTNIVKCHTEGNSKPTFENVSSCEPILRMELSLLNPHLVVTLGAVAFGVFCPDKVMSDCFGKISISKKFGVKVFPIYHPSPRNMEIDERRAQFEKDIRTLCKLIRAHRKKHGNNTPGPVQKV